MCQPHLPTAHLLVTFHSSGRPTCGRKEQHGCLILIFREATPSEATETTLLPLSRHNKLHLRQLPGPEGTRMPCSNQKSNTSYAVAAARKGTLIRTSATSFRGAFLTIANHHCQFGDGKRVLWGTQERRKPASVTSSEGTSTYVLNLLDNV